MNVHGHLADAQRPAKVPRIRVLTYTPEFNPKRGFRDAEIRPAI